MQIFVWSCANMTKTTYSTRNIVFPISKSCPNSCYHVLILSECDVCVSVFISNQLFVQTVVGPWPAFTTADSLIPAAAPTHWGTLWTPCTFYKTVKMSGLEDLGPMPEGWSLKWHGVGNTRRPWVKKYPVLPKCWSFSSGISSIIKRDKLHGMILESKGRVFTLENLVLETSNLKNYTIAVHISKTFSKLQPRQVMIGFCFIGKLGVSFADMKSVITLVVSIYTFAYFPYIWI